MSISSVLSRRKSLKNRQKLPVCVTEYHHEALYFMHEAVACRRLPLQGAVLLHFDAHPDMCAPQNMQADLVFDKDALYDALSIESWILPLLYARHYRHMVWFKPLWAHQLAEGSRKFLVGKCIRTGELRVTLRDVYFVTEGLYAHPDQLLSTAEVELHVITVPIAGDTSQGKLDASREASEKKEEGSSECGDAGVCLSGGNEVVATCCAALRSSQKVSSVDNLGIRTGDGVLSQEGGELPNSCGDKNAKTCGAASGNIERALSQEHRQSCLTFNQTKGKSVASVDAAGNESGPSKTCEGNCVGAEEKIHTELSNSVKNKSPPNKRRRSDCSEAQTPSSVPQPQVDSSSVDSKQICTDIVDTNVDFKLRRTSAVESHVDTELRSASSVDTSTDPKECSTNSVDNVVRSDKPSANSVDTTGDPEISTELRRIVDLLKRLVSESSAVVLDVDLDFFSTQDPFSLALTPHQVELVKRVYAVDVPADHCGDEELERCSRTAALHVTSLEQVLSSVERGRSLQEALEDPGIAEWTATFDRLPDLRELLESLTATPAVTLTMVHNCGCTVSDGTSLPHHVSSEREVRGLMASVETMLRLLGSTPAIATVARSTTDEYCPPAAVEDIQTRLLALLHRCYTHTDVILDYDSPDAS